MNDEGQQSHDEIKEGSKEKSQCSKCKGWGILVSLRWPYNPDYEYTKDCPECKGTGKTK